MHNIYTVGQINSYIKNMFAQDFLLQNISVKGEISNCKYHSSGHIYFTLKDLMGTISCVMFAGSRSGLSFRLAEGMQVMVQGAVAVYERDGKYQIYVSSIEHDGKGALYERYERLKQELLERGMFDSEYKQPIPRYISKLGVVTAPTGAAVRDIINIVSRRNPYVQILLYAAIVQGDAAQASIINGIKALERADVDIIIVGRGGGSIEDLWAFNEEAVAQAIFDCRIPIISAVGHETDTTIADYAADLRAPTPSAAAELAVYDVQEAEQRVIQYRQVLNRLMQARIQMNKASLQSVNAKLRFNSPLGRIRERKTLAMNLEDNLTKAMNRQLLIKRHILELYIEKLKGLSPLDKLKQGFSYVTDSEDRNVSNIQNVEIGDNIQIYLKNGTLKAVITEKQSRIPKG